VRPNHLLLEPRLFHCSNASGAFKVAEVHRFSQQDLCQDDVYLLDTGREIFMWIGHNSNAQEREHAAEAALDYAAKAPDGRRADTPVFKVIAGSEPPVFTCHFLVRTCRIALR
jgi:advillin